jgi:hypothetical protein
MSEPGWEGAENICDSNHADEQGYNGWSNYETWNVALWIDNDEGLNELARECDCYTEFVDVLRELGVTETPDEVAWNDSGIDKGELVTVWSDMKEEDDD